MLEALSLLQAYRDLRTGTDAARAAAHELGSDPSTWTPQTASAAGADADRGQALIDRASGRLHGDPLLQGAARIPWAGDSARATLDLAQAAAAGATATRDAAQVARLYGDASTSPGSPARYLEILKKAEPLLGDASTHLHAALDLVNRDRGGALIRPLPAQLDNVALTLATTTAQADSFRRATTLAPAALGDPSARTYLVMLANPTELRPDGGFAGVVGTITFDHGTPTSIHLVDQGSLNNSYKQTFPIPPPIKQHLVEANNSLEIGDAAWDPDLPTTAPLLENLWLSATGQQVDGTLVIDPYAIQALMTVTGPVTVAGYGQFTSEDFLTRLNVLINASNGDKATAVPLIAGQVLRSILGQPGQNYPRMASILLEQGRQRHLQVFAHDRKVEGAVSDYGLDGSIREPALRDYVMVVDANLAATKGDAYVDKQAEIRVEKPASGLSNHEVKLTYHFNPPRTDTDRKLATAPSNGNPDGYYRDYVRVYVPQEANLTGFLVQVDGRPAISNSVAEYSVLHNKRVIGAYFEIKPGQTATVAMTYVVPLEPGRGYELLVQKQAGRPKFDTSLWLTYPGGEARRTTPLLEDEILKVDS